MKKTYRIKTNNQELLIRKQNESDATSRWIEFQKTRPKGWISEKLIELCERFNRQKGNAEPQKKGSWIYGSATATIISLDSRSSRNHSRETQDLMVNN